MATQKVWFHSKKIKESKKENKKAIYYEKLLGSIQDKFSVSQDQETAVPKRLSLEAQGMFILGYYHQTQKHFEKKDKEDQEHGRGNSEQV